MIFDINNGVIEKNTLMNSTIKIKNEKIDIESKDKKPINKEDLINEIQLNSYSCTKCKSEIELESITFNDEKTEDSITYICKEKCGKITKNIKYFKKIIDNIYFEYIKYKKIFIYCINCNKIFCNNCKCNFEHNNYININDINTKCSFHKDNDLCGYCLNDKTHLCNKCLKNGQHTNHNIAKLSEFEIPSNGRETYGWSLGIIVSTAIYG